jgi:molybdopterin synthase sulfur carrier subunit
MRVEVLYFAVVRELLGRDAETVELPENVRDVREFRAWIEGRHDVLAGRLASVRIARNEEFARDDVTLADGDTLALIPPVAGG